MKVEMDMYYLIRSHHNDGMSIRTIAKTLGISRQTVTKYCDGTTIPGNRKEYHRDSTIITDEPREFILSCFRDVGRILRTFKIKKNVEVTDNGKIII